MNWCEKHDHFKRTCPWCEIEILQERLNRIAAIVNVLEQHGDIDHTTLTQLRMALSWEKVDESQVYGNDCPTGKCEM